MMEKSMSEKLHNIKKKENSFPGSPGSKGARVCGRWEKTHRGKKRPVGKKKTRIVEK